VFFHVFGGKFQIQNGGLFSSRAGTDPGALIFSAPLAILSILGKMRKNTDNFA
jgi:hypothetical protein